MTILVCGRKEEKKARRGLQQAVAKDERVLALQKRLEEKQQEHLRLKQRESSKAKTSEKAAAHTVRSWKPLEVWVWSVKSRKKWSCLQPTHCFVEVGFFMPLAVYNFTLYSQFHQKTLEDKDWEDLEQRLARQIQWETPNTISQRKDINMWKILHSCIIVYLL